MSDRHVASARSELEQAMLQKVHFFLLAPCLFAVVFIIVNGLLYRCCRYFRRFVLGLLFSVNSR